MTDEKIPYMEDAVFSGDDSEWVDASYQLTTRETRWVESKIYEVNRQRAIASKIFPTMKVPAGCKEYIIEIDDESESSVFDDNFMREDHDVSRKSENTYYLAYAHKDFRVLMTDADAVANAPFHKMGLPQQTIRNLTGTVAGDREKVFWRGYDIAGRDYAAANNQGLIDTSVKGILNTSGINTFNADGGSTADITAAGDGPAGQGAAIASLVTDDFYGPYWHFMTPEVWSQLNVNRNATTGRTDLSIMLEAVDMFGNKMIQGIRVTKALLPTVEASGSEANWAVIDPKDQNGSPTIVLLEAYPLSALHTPPIAGIQSSGKIVWAGVAAVIRPEAITLEQDIVY